MSVTLDADGGVWAGTKFGGLNYIAPSGRVTRVPLRIQNTEVAFVWRVQMIGTTLWVGTYGHGLARLSYRLEEQRPVVTARTTHVHDAANPYSPSDDFILDIFQDRSGVVWMGTDNNGLSLFYDVPHVRPLDASLGDERSLQSATVIAVLKQPSRLWVGTTEGLYARRSADAPFESVAIPDTSSFIRCLRPGPDGWLWICTNYGLYRYHPGQGRLHDVYAALRAQGIVANDRFFDMAFQPDGTAWAATDRGIVALRTAGPTLVEGRLLDALNQKLASQRIRCLAVQRDTTWIGTTDGGLARVVGANGDLQTLAALLDNPLYNTAKVLDVAFDAETAWVATHGGGVVRIRGEHAPTVYTKTEGLPGTIVHSIAVDTSRNRMGGNRRGIGSQAQPQRPF